MQLEDDVRVLKGIGEKTSASLSRMGIRTVGDLIRSYPVRYEKFSDIRGISDAVPGETCTFRGVFATSPALYRSGKMPVTSIRLEDQTGRITLVWFRMPYLKNSLVKGAERIVRGRVIQGRNGLTVDQPALFDEEEYELLSKEWQPVYAVEGSVTVKMMRKICRQALGQLDLETDYLPADIRKKYQLAEWNYAVRTIHFPKDEQEMLYARKRLVFDEFLLFILAVRQMKNRKEQEKNGFVLRAGSWSTHFLESLPYQLTGAQRRVWDEIRRNLEGETLMNRLIQGDVGSGKTVLAQLALLCAAENGCQGAIMAPTEVLARQHYESFTSMFEKYDIPARCILLSGSMTASQKRKAYEAIRNHEADIIMGTHALIQEKVVYDRLALVITDEQHRFGVHQREDLAGKGERPHILVMSATPIPRTLAMILYGDMDISVVDELPADRLPVKNAVVDTSWRPKAYRFIEKQIAEGRQAYVICPMVEESEGLEAENVLDYTEKLRSVLPDSVRVEYLHGKMKPKDKNTRMEEFAAGSIQVLVSTTVVEVGVNVPNAAVMMIENAERFGLAQLHQLRGRVGRGKYQSYCIFVDGSGEAGENRRLKVLGETNDGFKIASEDLKLRGPGDVFGVRQSGDLSFAIGDIFTDAKVLKAASEAAEGLFADDPDLEKKENRNLLAQLRRYQGSSAGRMYL